jgi:ATP-dependent DNA helicase RecG
MARMTRDELRQLVEQVRRRQIELDNVEVKAARGGTPKRLYEPLSAFANQTGGGVLLFGLDEEKGFSLVGVGDPQRLQADLTNLASAEMEPALRPQFTVDETEGETIIAAEIEGIPARQKPCFYKPAGLPKGVYIRVGNTNRQMTEYEVFGYLSGRGQPRDDEEIVPDAEVGDLDGALLDDYLGRLRRERSPAVFLEGNREEMLMRLHIVASDGKALRPTLAGLLTFGKYPQEFFPQLMITFVQFYGTTEEEKTPQGARFLDNQRFEGPITEMVERAENHVLGAMRKSSLIEGLFRRDIPEYPREALREAVANAVAHRDYSPYVRGSYIQIRMFADRLEVQSPGGLFGNVTVENLEEEHSTRNARLMRMMEDLHVVENRGSGIRAMLQAMREANLEPPRFNDRRSSFVVAFRNHTLMNPDTIAWLNRFSRITLSDRQRVALAYLRENPEIANQEYRHLNRVDPATAGQELRGLVQTGLVEQHGFGRGTTYRLSVSRDLPSEQAPQAARTPRDRILDYVRWHGSINNSECRELLGVGIQRASYLLKKMVAEGKLTPVGSRRNRRYRPHE